MHHDNLFDSVYSYYALDVTYNLNTHLSKRCIQVLQIFTGVILVLKIMLPTENISGPPFQAHDVLLNELYQQRYNTLFISTVNLYHA